jgi:hypothetical protein
VQRVHRRRGLAQDWLGGDHDICKHLLQAHVLELCLARGAIALTAFLNLALVDKLTFDQLAGAALRGCDARSLSIATA